MNARVCAIFAVAMFACLPMAQATPSGLTYLDSTWSSIDGEAGELIALSPNQTILASYHGKEIILFNTSTLERVGEFHFDEDIAGMEFNPNGSLLAINKRSTATLKESIKIIDMTSMEVLEDTVLVDDRFRDISWSADGKLLAAQGNDGDVEQYHIPELNLKNTLLNVHVVDITCIDYNSDGVHILTGDKSGRWAIWNLQGELQDDYYTFSEGLNDCKFSPDGLDIVLLGENGKITSSVFNGQEKHSTIIEGGKEILFSQIINRMHIPVESPNFRGLVSYDYNSFTSLTNTTFFHRVEDVAFTEKSNGRIASLFVAGGTGEVAVYLRELTPLGYNQPGVDLDGDLVPDDLDDDDDGDGIIDQWDDDIGCDAPEGIPCSRYPDLEKIRSIEILIDEKFVISDEITLPTEDSSHIRNLSRNAVAKDNVISSSEVDLFADAMCKNMNHDDIIEQWRDAIVLSNGELGSGTVSCEISSGMQLIRDGDSTTQISMIVTTTFAYSSPVSLPLEISLTEQPLPTDGSIAWLAPSHPISLKFEGQGVETAKIPLWWNDESNSATVTINQVSVKNPDIFEKALVWALHPLAFILYLGILVLLITAVIRWSNRIDFDDQDDEIEDEVIEDEEEIEMLEEKNKISSPYDESKGSSSSKMNRDLQGNDKSDNGTKMSHVKIQESQPAKKRKMYSTSGNQDQVLVKKRRVTDSKLNKEGPIMKTKRRRLVADEIPNQKPSDSADIQKDSSPTKIKKRKVKVETENVEPKRKRKVKLESTQVETEKDEPEKKKRKSVKRKSKTTSSETSIEKESVVESKKAEKKLIDEKELQENLIDDFMSE